MYQVDEHDTVVPLDGVPAPDVGAPLPVIVATEHRVDLIYVASTGSGPRAVVRVSFDSPSAHMLGPPNDEAFSGHPLAARGLAPYAAWEIHSSSWLRSIERMNAVHPLHHPSLFEEVRHFVFAFHDTTFECLADGYALDLQHKSIAEAIAAIPPAYRQ